MRSLLLYNPSSGVRHGKRVGIVAQIAARLSTHGFAVEVTPTVHRGSAAHQIRRAVQQGVEVVFVCGGDGTIHDALQGIKDTPAMLAPIPLGSGNALCRELGIPLHPLRAAAAYATTMQRDIRIGSCESEGISRSFLLMAGAGPDGALMHHMLTAGRSRLGRWAYALHALRLFFRSSLRPFRVRYQTADATWHESEAVSAMALRIGNLGGIFPGIARGASLNSPSMRLVLVHAPASLSLPLWFLSAWLHLERWNPLLVQEEVTTFQCDGDGIHAQADGEWVGRLPLSASLTETTVRLLIPTAG